MCVRVGVGLELKFQWFDVFVVTGVYKRRTFLTTTQRYGKKQTFKRTIGTKYIRKNKMSKQITFWYLHHASPFLLQHFLWQNIWCFFFLVCWSINIDGKQKYIFLCAKLSNPMKKPQCETLNASVKLMRNAKKAATTNLKNPLRIFMRKTFSEAYYYTEIRRHDSYFRIFTIYIRNAIRSTQIFTIFPIYKCCYSHR